jgi:cytochrome c peroxidase
MNKLIPAFIAAAVALLSLKGTIDLNNLNNYSNQGKPAYIMRDNTTVGNQITDAGATLGRVLFYDKSLSVNNTVSCASCHQQQFAFSDTAIRSTGLSGGFTGRHSMRLVNARFAEETHFFWDERALTLEAQTSRPIQDHVEMGFSGTSGDPDLDSLIRKMNKINYYNKLFKFVYGDTVITETRIQNALAQFVRSIQSFDTKFDIGRAQVNNDAQPFPNFTQQENQGKQLFLAPPPQGGAGCQGCHRAPEFDIDPNSRNNGVIGIAGGGTGTDLTNTKSPSLRELVNPSGALNGPAMHSGIFNNLDAIINHYNNVPVAPGNNNIDPRLTPGGQPQQLNLTQQQIDALAAFLRTLTGSNVYTDPKWSNPFDSNGSLNLIELTTGIYSAEKVDFSVYPNPAAEFVTINTEPGDYKLKIYAASGQLIASEKITGTSKIDLTPFSKGVLIFELTEIETLAISRKTIVKN